MEQRLLSRCVSSRRTVRPIVTTFGLVALAMLPGVLPAQSTIEVPGTVPSIQQAILVAQSGDTIVVAPGTYFEAIDLLGKAITLRSSDGPLVTSIDAQNGGSVVTMTSGEGPDTVLEGFTITGGQIVGLDMTAGGAGIRIEDGAPVIRDNIIRDNVSSWRGAGIYAVNSNARIERNRFISNSFFAPVADIWYGLGGGICVFGGEVEIIECAFTANVGGDTGGGVYLEGTAGSLLRSNIFTDNVNGLGGAIGVGPGSTVTIENVLATGNIASGRTSFIGPGEGLGGAIGVFGATSVVIDGATLVGNSCLDGFFADGEGAGVFVDGLTAAPVVVRNAIIRGNVAGLSSQVHPAVAVSYANIEGGFVGGTAIIDADPLFATGPEGDFYLQHTAAGEPQTSPCVDAGDPATVPFGTTRTDGGADVGPVDLGWHFLLDAIPWRRGDCNDDTTVNIADAVFLLGNLFPGPGSVPPIGCEGACDANDDGNLNIADAIAILGSLFVQPSIPIPPPAGSCGADPSPDPLTCDAFDGC